MSTLTNDCRCDPFCIACRVGDLEDIKYYVEQGLTPADVNMEGNITYFGREETGLYWAAIGGRHQTVDYLINHLLGGVTDIEKIDAVYKRHFHYDWDEEDTYTFEPLYDFLRERGGLRRHEIPGIYFGYFSANDPEERVDDY